MGEMADYYLSQFDGGDYWENTKEDEIRIDYPRKAERGPGPCPLCDKPTVKKEGRFGQFYGCSTFPKCKGSRCAI